MTRFDEPLARLVELRFFAGLTVGEIADLEDKPVWQVEQDWRLARAWLRQKMSPDEQ